MIKIVYKYMDDVERFVYVENQVDAYNVLSLINRNEEAELINVYDEQGEEITNI